jgi:hypothetical protein
MIQTRTVQALADSHRRDLLASAGPRRAGDGDGTALGAGATPDPGAGRRAVRGSGARRALAPRLGAWMIDFGTKLGGATIRTS